MKQCGTYDSVIFSIKFIAHDWRIGKQLQAWKNGYRGLSVIDLTRRESLRITYLINGHGGTCNKMYLYKKPFDNNNKKPIVIL